MKKFVAVLLCVMTVLSLNSCGSNKDALSQNDSTNNTCSQIPHAENAMQMFEAAIKGEICVLDERAWETSLKSLRFPSNDISLDECKLLKKAMIDADQDGVGEFVIKSPDQEYIILRYYNGKVYSYRLDTCEFYNLNTDGSFHWYDTPEEDGWACGLDKITFEGETLSIKPIYSIQYSKDPTNYEYFVEGEAVTEDEYNACRSHNARYERINFSEFEMSCSYPITAEQAWNLANAYWDNQDGATDCGAGTTWTARIELIDIPNFETDNYRFAFLHESTSNGGGEGDECMPPYNVRTMDQILVNAFTGEVVASTYEPDAESISVEEAIEIAKNDFDNKESKYRFECAPDDASPDHIYVIVIKEYVGDHYSYTTEKWIDKYTGEIVSSYYMWGK